MTEGDLLKTVLEMCKLFGLKTAHFRPARRMDASGRERWETPVQGDGKGFPDLVVAGKGGVLFRELKSDIGRPSPEQCQWLRALGDAGADEDVWCPRDLRSGRIEGELRALRKPQLAVRDAPQPTRKGLSAIPQF